MVKNYGEHDLNLYGKGNFVASFLRLSLHIWIFHIKIIILESFDVLQSCRGQKIEAIYIFIFFELYN